MAQLNYPWNFHVTKSRSISFEIGAQHQRDQCQNFSLGHNFMDKTFDWSKISKNWFHKIIHKFGSVTTKWLVFQKAPPFIFIWLLKWSCLGHNKMNQAKNPEWQAGRVDIAVEQCAPLYDDLNDLAIHACALVLNIYFKTINLASWQTYFCL